MKTRLLPVLLLAATFPFAALAQSSTGTGGTSSSSNGSDNGTNSGAGASSGGTGGTSSSSNNNDNGTGSGSTAGSSSPGTGGTSAPSSSSSGTSSDAGANSSASGSGTGALSTSGSAGTASAGSMVTIPGAAAVSVADLRGKTVYGVDGSSIGQISEVLASADGAANSVVINSGGKNVVVSLSSLQMAPSQATGATGTDTMSSNSAGVSSAQANTASPSDGRIVLNMTREQLDQAPAYTGSSAP